MGIVNILLILHKCIGYGSKIHITLHIQNRIKIQSKREIKLILIIEIFYLLNNESIMYFESRSVFTRHMKRGLCRERKYIIQ